MSKARATIRAPSPQRRTANDGLAVLLRRALAEFIGTALLLIAIIGSGIAAQRLIVSCADAIFGGLRPRHLAAYVVAQLAGGVVGVILANLMFSLAAVSVATHDRSSPNLWLSEVIAAFGLLLVVFGVTRGGRVSTAPFAVDAYITGAYFFTSSTSFANPAVTLARTLSDTFAGISPGSVAAFIIAQIIGAALACGVIRALWPRVDDSAQAVIVPHQASASEARLDSRA